MHNKSEVTIRDNAVRFNQKTGRGSIVIRGKFPSRPDVDDPVIEIWNAVQEQIKNEFLQKYGREPVYFTILFPTYDEDDDVTTYELFPANSGTRNAQMFLAEAKITIKKDYRKPFVENFRSFLNDRNVVCNYNGYSLYSKCLEKIDEETNPEKRAYHIETTRMLLENFILFLGLPLPHSKEECSRKAFQASLEQLRNSDSLLLERLHYFGSSPVSDLLSLSDSDLEEIFDYSEEA